eukprot:scaffold1087_cov154-Amphora_coffeaeformis.AAC.3
MAPKFQKGPDLKRFMVRYRTAYDGLALPTHDKRLKVSLNGNRTLVGTLRGYDAFLNVVLEDVEQQEGQFLGQVVIRGNSIVQFEGLERVAAA